MPEFPPDPPRATVGRSRRAEGVFRGFTLLEVLVATAVFLILVTVLLSVIGQAGSVWQRSRNDAASYQSARFAFDLISRTLSQARMNVYQDYDDPAQPTAYLRKSDLHFVITDVPGTNFGQGNAVFFQAPANRTLDSDNLGGLPGILNSVGYYVTYGKNPSLPNFLQGFDRNRFRLMQFLAPAEKMAVFLTNAASDAWYGNDYLSDNSTVVADNVILLLFWPRLPAEEDAEGDDLPGDFGDAYRYDSRWGTNSVPQPVTANQQPPLVQVTLVALDETIARRLPDSSSPPNEVTSLLSDLFAAASEEQYREDLGELERRLNNARMAYRIFDGKVPLRESKWSK